VLRTRQRQETRTGFIPIVCIFLYSYKSNEQKGSSKLTRKNMGILDKINWTLVWTVFAGLITILAGFAQWSDKRKEERNAKLSEAKAEKATNELTELQKENNRKTDDLSKANAKIAELATEIKNLVTGGNSIPFLRLTTSTGFTAENPPLRYFNIQFNLVNHGEYPLHNVVCKIADLYTYDMITEHGLISRIMGSGVSIYSPSKEEIKAWRPESISGPITLTLNKTYPVYIAILSSEIRSSTNFQKLIYPVEIEWSNGSLKLYVEVDFVKDAVEIKHVELVVNGKESKEDYHKFVSINI
jgi:hypothetical protein